MYGPGDSDVVAMDMELDSSENIFIGGQSKFIQAIGEGFVMLVDEWGEASFTKTYASGAAAGDIVNKVEVEGTNYIAVGTSNAGATNTFFFLNFGATGTIIKNLLIATDVTKVANTASITQLDMQGPLAIVTFDVNTNIIIDIVGAVADRYIGYVSEVGNMIRMIIHANGIHYSFFSIKDTKLTVYLYDSTSTAATTNGNIHANTHNPMSPTAALQTSDTSTSVAPVGAWIGVVPLADSSLFHAYSFTTAAANYPTVSNHFAIPTVAAVLSLKISWVSVTTFYMSAMLSNGQGNLYYEAAGACTSRIFSPNLSGTYFMGRLIGTEYVAVGNRNSGESAALTSSQVIIFKSIGTTMLVAAYNCYDITASDLSTPVAHTFAAGTADATSKTMVTGTSTQTTDPTVPADSTEFPIRAESTEAATAGGFCDLQLPIFNFNASVTYTTSANDYVTLKAMISHCQGATMTYVPTVATASETWAVGASDSLGIIPSAVTATHCCNFANTLTVQAFADNTVTNTASDTIGIIFTDASPAVIVAVPDQVFYKGQGATVITGSSITDSTTLAFTLTTAVTTANYTTLTIDTTDGDPITIGMASNYTGTATMTITATDTGGNTATDVFDVLVLECPQDNCDLCTSGTVGDCIGCDAGYILTSGECFPPVIPPVIPEPIYYSSYLNTGVGDAN
jgi:hypothetical protein